MSKNAPASPPPPPPPPTNTPKKTIVPPGADAEEQLEAIILRFGLKPDGKSNLRIHNKVVPIPQSGPTCGPVALAMLLECNAEEIVKMARMQRFSNNGEMFSCRNMLELAQMAAERLSLEVEFILQRGDLCSEAIVDELFRGAWLLVPYDSDFNHSPCLKRGHRAHWALITGIYQKAPNGLRCPCTENTFVFAMHGKSKHLAMWELHQLAASNENLTEFPPHRERDELEYVVPPGGVTGENGLCSQFIIVKDLKKLS